MQMVLRLLAFNAEVWLADHLNANLSDADEYRAITSNLLKQGGTIDYTPTNITITLECPDSSCAARALQLIIEEPNNTPSRFPGDHRTLDYQAAEAQTSPTNECLLKEV